MQKCTKQELHNPQQTCLRSVPEAHLCTKKLEVQMYFAQPVAENLQYSCCDIAVPLVQDRRTGTVNKVLQYCAYRTITRHEAVYYCACRTEPSAKQTAIQASSTAHTGLPDWHREQGAAVPRTQDQSTP
jgi:hypothetical protein